MADLQAVRRDGAAVTDAPTLWSAAAAREARDEALERVADPPWQSFAMQALQTVAQREPVVTSDMVWMQLDAMGIPRPLEARAMGPVMVAAVRSGLLEPLGYTQGTNPKHHADIQRTYRSRLERLVMGDACDRCRGRGYVWNGYREIPCRACDGTGRTLPGPRRPSR